MQIELTIRANSLSEIAHIFSVGTMIPDEPIEGAPPTGRASTKEVEPETPARKPRGSRKGSTDAAPPAAEESKAPAGAEASPPANEKVSFEDLRAAASSLMDSGKADGRKIQQMLLEKFDVKAFGALNEEQYPAALAELQDLAA